MEATADNTAYTLRAYTLALRDIATFGRNVVYAGNVRCHCAKEKMNIFEELKQLLLNNGASLVGYCSLKLLSAEVRKKFKTGISIGLKLDYKIIKEIIEGPTLAYLNEYQNVNKKLDSLSGLAADFLEKKGYNTDHWGATDDRIYGHHMTDLPHKTLATLSGLGWIGKCALLITKKFGSAIRFTSVITELSNNIFDNSIKESFCNECTICVNKCPGNAPKGINWIRGMDRNNFFDPDLCRKTARNLAKKRTGIEYTFCGICIACCPYTINYINKNESQKMAQRHLTESL